MSNMSIDNNSPISIYQQIADQIRADIDKKVLNPGDKIPSEKWFVDNLEVARGTVRKAISLLVEEGTLEKVQGKGTFVTKPQFSYPFAQELVSYAETMKMKNIDYTTKVMEQKVVQPPVDIQKKLKLTGNQKVLYLVRLRSVEDTPAILTFNWISLDRCPDLEKVDFNKVALFDAIEKTVGIKIKYGIRNFSACSLSKNQAKIMELSAGNAALELNQVTFASDDEPIECSDALLRTDQYKVTSILYR
ncbi:GntR family transcriptional regulator [Lactobacillus sp. XV13L]|nr:GntR family transcriptional regulator [Lactobacillus sp. XV13L]